MHGIRVGEYDPREVFQKSFVYTREILPSPGYSLHEMHIGDFDQRVHYRQTCGILQGHLRGDMCLSALSVSLWHLTLLSLFITYSFVSLCHMTLLSLFVT